MYSLAGYGEMLADGVRRRAYEDALRAAVRPGSTVIELGTGPGYFAMLAARLGADTVYALEPADVVTLAERTAAVNGLAERIVFVQERSDRFEAPARADILVSDLRDVLPLFGDHLPAIVDARERLLRQGGALIPERDELWVAAVEAPDTYQRLLGGWRSTELDFELAREAVANRWIRALLPAEACLSDPERWARLDYRRLESADVTGELALRATRAGAAHGLAVWFETALFGDIGFANRPGAPETIYRQAFFPFPAPLTLAAGDVLEVRLEARLVNRDYLWRWHTRHRPRDGGVNGRSFEQSTFFATPLAERTLRKRATSYRPRASEEARILRFVLARMDGSASNAAIAEALQGAFPERFGNAREALDQVCDLAGRYG